MNHTRTAAVVLAATGLLLPACSSSPPRSHTACPPSATPRPGPSPHPASWAILTDAADGPLLCFNVTEATAPDHHDAFHDPASDEWTITAVTPAAGTAVAEHQPITLTVDNHNN